MGIPLHKCLPKAPYEFLGKLTSEELTECMESFDFVDLFHIVGDYCGCGRIRFHSLRYCSFCGTEFRNTNMSLRNFYRQYPTETGLNSIFSAVVHSEFFGVFVRPSWRSTRTGSSIIHFREHSWDKIVEELRRCTKNETRKIHTANEHQKDVVRRG